MPSRTMDMEIQIHEDRPQGEDTVKSVLLMCPNKLGGCYVQDKHKGSFIKRERNLKVTSTMG